MNKTLLIQGSSRSDGHTALFSQYLCDAYDMDFIDLNRLKIGHFDYDFNNRNDDFLPTIEKMIVEYDVWIFATPVYWYSMSGIMKAFFDRITDLLTEYKTLGRQIRGKNMGSLSISNDDDLEVFFHEPFRLSSSYLGMNYLGSCHAFGDGKKIDYPVKSRIDAWMHKILEITASDNP